MDDLQRFIAQKLGWHEFEMSSYWDESYDDVIEVRCLFGTSPTGDYRPLPAWTTSVDVALTLPLPDKVGFYLMYAAGYDAIARIADFNTDETLVKIYHKNPTAAICEAWKTWITTTLIL